MADKVKLINRLAVWWLGTVIRVRRDKASMGRLAMLATWATVLVIISLLNYLVDRGL